MLGEKSLYQLGGKIKKKKKRLLLDKATIKDLKKKLDEVTAWATNAEEKAIKLLKAESLRAIDEYKKSTNFKKEVTKMLSYCYEYGFDDCKEKVKELFPKLNLKKIVLREEEGEEEEGEI